MISKDFLNINLEVIIDELKKMNLNPIFLQNQLEIILLTKLYFRQILNLLSSPKLVPMPSVLGKVDKN